MNLEQRKLWSEGHKELNSIILKPEQHENAASLFLNLHNRLYCSRSEESTLLTLEDELLNNLNEETFRTYPVSIPGTKNSIAWHLWHIARIEDMTMNVLVNADEQIFYTGDWCEKLRVGVEHSGNGMSEAEIAQLSEHIDLAALLSYRVAVGIRTREIIQSLIPGQFKQKVEASQISKLADQSSVKKEEEWLLQYWGNKTIAGLVLMPATRHNFLHLNKALRIKGKIDKKLSIS